MVWRGDAGWAEWSPFLDYDGPELVPWLRAADEAAEQGWPAPVRTEIPVNSTIPAVGPEQAYALARAAGCRTAKVKVAEAGGIAGRRPGPGRGRARRARPGRPDPGGRQRRLVGGRGLQGDRGAAAVRSGVRRAALPHRRRAGRAAPPAGPGRGRRADRGRRVDPPGRRPARRWRARNAADIAVLKVQPLGGVRAGLEIAERIGLPVVVSSALETSIGLRAGLALAAALPGAAVRLRPEHGRACWPTTWSPNRWPPWTG